MQHKHKSDLVTLPVVVNVLKGNQLRLSAEVSQNILQFSNN